MTVALREARRTSASRLLGAQALAAIVLLALCLASLLIGSRTVSPAALVEALAGRGGDDLNTLLWEVRLPRTIAALLVGAALAWAGTLMHGMTRNPLADPGLLGVSSGAAFAVTIAMTWFGVRSATGIAGSAVAGAAIVTAAVLALGLRGAASGTKLVLAGVAFSMTVSGVQSAVTLLNPRALDAMRAWSAGSLASPNTSVLWETLPLIAFGGILAFALARPIDALALGDDTARGLGSHPFFARAGTGVAAACLVGAATAIAGPIGFIGLMVPHFIRPFTGPSTGRMILFGTPVGAALLLTADILARTVLWPGELPVGVIAAALGAPVILIVLRRRA